MYRCFRRRRHRLKKISIYILETLGISYILLTLIWMDVFKLFRTSDIRIYDLADEPDADFDQKSCEFGGQLNRHLLFSHEPGPFNFNINNNKQVESSKRKERPRFIRKKQKNTGGFLKPGQSQAPGLWPEDCPNSDRIVEQILYVPSSPFFRLHDSPYMKRKNVSHLDPPTPIPKIVKRKGKNPVKGQGQKPIAQFSIKIDEEDDEHDRVQMLVPNITFDILKEPNQGVQTILLFDGFKTWGPDLTEDEGVFLKDKCPVNACRLSKNVSKIEEADAVVFSRAFDQPVRFRSAHQLWIMYVLESPENSLPNIDPRVLFNLTATYRRDSDIVAPYAKWVYYNDRVRKLPQSKNYAFGKTKKVAWFVSNCQAKNNRIEYARELSQHIQVDVYSSKCCFGNCLDHLTCSQNNQTKCFELLRTQYKFYLAFENSNCRDYITEKFFANALQNDIVPIVLGAHPDDYRRAAPRKSYIHVDDFESPKHLAEYLHLLDNNDLLYNEYFEWKGTGEFIQTLFFCRLCAMIHHYRQQYQQGNETPQISGTNNNLQRGTKKKEEPKPPSDKLFRSTNFYDWWNASGGCVSGSWRSHPNSWNDRNQISLQYSLLGDF